MFGPPSGANELKPLLRRWGRRRVPTVQFDLGGASGFHRLKIHFV